MLDDQRILKLSRKIFTYWDDLARLLSVAEGDISELMESDGHSYHGAFRMLFAWRESSKDLQASLEAMHEALRQLGHGDVMELVFRR